MSLKIAILASGNGSNAEAFFERIKAGTLDCEAALVLCNRPGARVLERAEKAGVPHICLDHKEYASREEFDRAMIAEIKKAGAEIVVLAGYMRLLSNEFISAFAGKIINIHPALLPAFPGLSGAADAKAWGVKITGCTVHFVDEIMDNGPVIIQAAVPVNAAESLEALQMRIHKLEHRIYPQALQWLAEKRLKTVERQVHLLPGSRQTLAPDAGSLVWPPLEEGF